MGGDLPRDNFRVLVEQERLCLCNLLASGLRVIAVAVVFIRNSLGEGHAILLDLRFGQFTL